MSETFEQQYTIEQMAEQRWFYYLKEKNKKGETMTIEISKTTVDPKDKKSLPYLWWKHGWIGSKLSSYWCISTYVRDGEGNCIGKYNPQHARNGEVNFDWMLEGTEENKNRLINEVIRLFYNRKEGN